MTTQIHNLHVRSSNCSQISYRLFRFTSDREYPVGSEPEQTVGNLRAVFGDSTHINKAWFRSWLAWIHFVDELLPDHLYVMPENTTDKPMEHILDAYGTNRGEEILEKDTISLSDYDRPAQDDARIMNLEPFKNHEEDRLGRFIDDKCKRIVLPLFWKAQKLDSNNGHSYLPVEEAQAINAIFLLKSLMRYSTKRGTICWVRRHYENSSSSSHQVVNL